MSVTTHRGRWLAVLVLPVLIGFAAAGCSGDDDTTVTTSTPSTAATGAAGGGGTAIVGVSTPANGEVKVAAIADGRQILTDAGGFTLYVFANDVPDSGKSTCNASCAQAWPPFAVVSSPTGPPEAGGVFSTMTRLDGTSQAVYNGKPLYRFVNDTAPGDTNGEGVAPTWTIATP